MWSEHTVKRRRRKTGEKEGKKEEKIGENWRNKSIYREI